MRYEADDIAVIDVETATSDRGSACAVGAALVREGSLVVQKWLVRPPGNQYDGFNMMIHGIGPNDTESAPSFEEVWRQVDAVIEDRLLVAHNAAFDCSVLRRSLARCGVPLPREYGYLCTYRLAKQVWPERWTYQLDYLVQDLGLDASHHHDPAWDAVYGLQIAAAIAASLDARSLSEASHVLGFPPGRLLADPWLWEPFSTYKERRWKAADIKRKAGDLTPSGNNFDTDHPLYEQTVVITGALPNGMTRREAYQTVVDLGGAVADGVSKKVNILVVADLNPAVVGADGMSGKLRRAKGLAAEGHPIELMDAREFLRLLVAS